MLDLTNPVETFLMIFVALFFHMSFCIIFTLLLLVHLFVYLFIYSCFYFLVQRYWEAKLNIVMNACALQVMHYW